MHRVIKLFANEKECFSSVGLVCVSRMRDHLVVFQIEVIFKSEFSKNLFCFLRNIVFKIYAMWPL